MNQVMELSRRDKEILLQECMKDPEPNDVLKRAAKKYLKFKRRDMKLLKKLVIPSRLWDTPLGEARNIRYSVASIWNSMYDVYAENGVISSGCNCGSGKKCCNNK